jgi:hypothetical protein
MSSQLEASLFLYWHTYNGYEEDLQGCQKWGGDFQSTQKTQGGHNMQPKTIESLSNLFTLASFVLEQSRRQRL